MNARAIWEYLNTHGPKTAGEIRAHFGMGSKRAQQKFREMRQRDTLILEDGLYKVGKPLTRGKWACKQERIRAHNEARRRRNGIKPLSEHLAALAKVRAEKAAQRAKRPFDQPIQPRTLQPTESAPAKPVLMSSQEWEAKGGKVQRLESNWQKPSGRISFPVSFF